MSYNEKHNEANGEDNRDGESHNRSWNCGVEGPDRRPRDLALRRRQMRNFLATLMFSQGTPMIAHGDEIGRTQNGNNNVYCQDSELAWMDWSLVDKNADLLAFARKVRAPCGREASGVSPPPVLRGEPIRTGDEVHDIAWLTPGGVEMTHEDWDKSFTTGVWRSSSTARPSARPMPAASGWSTTRSCCASTPMTSASSS